MSRLNPTPLPDKPSELILAALHDLSMVEKSKKYVVNMTASWHSGVSMMRDKCTVCLAGAVISQRFESDHTLYRPASFFGQMAQRKFHALNSFRRGEIGDAFLSLEMRRPKGIPSEFQITPYDDGPRKFRKDMKKMAAMLKRNGV